MARRAFHELIQNSPFIAGPLAGYSHKVYRELIHSFGGIAYGTTEMISAQSIIQNSRHLRRLTSRSENEHTLCYQLASACPHEAGKATAILSDLGADIIDLNCGCPKPKIRKKGQGSALLNDPQLLSRMLKSMRANTDALLSIKIRIDGNSHDQNNTQVIQVINDSDIDFCVIHARHWQDSYDIPCHDAQLASCVDKINKPVVGNGDICDLPSIKRMQDCGVSGLMIARGAMGRPWIFKELLATLQNEHFVPPGTSEKIDLCLSHIEGIAALYGNERIALAQARKICGYYARHCPSWSYQMTDVIACQTLSQFKDYMQSMTN